MHTQKLFKKSRMTYSIGLSLLNKGMGDQCSTELCFLNMLLSVTYALRGILSQNDIWYDGSDTIHTLIDRIECSELDCDLTYWVKENAEALMGWDTNYDKGIGITRAYAVTVVTRIQEFLYANHIL